MNRFKQARKNKKISTLQIAKLFNYSQKAVENWENGINQPNHETLIKLAALYDVSVDYLLGNEEGITITKKEYEALIKAKEAIANIEKRETEKSKIDIHDNEQVILQNNGIVSSKK